MAKALCSLQCKSVDLKGMKYTDSSEKDLVNEGEKHVQLWLMSIIVCHVFCSLTHFNIDLVGVSIIRFKARPVHIHPHHKLLFITRKSGHSCGVLKGRSNLDQTAVRVIYGAKVRKIASVWSVGVVDVKVTDVAGAVVAIHNVPGEGDVGAVLIGFKVANNFLGICKCLA